MRGSLWTEKSRSTSGTARAAEMLGAFLVCSLVGVAAGLAAAHIRLHLGLPGHKALLLMTPVVFARLILRSPVGATGGMLAAALSSLAAGGGVIGATLHLPLVAVAGGMFDVAIGLAERWRVSARWAIPLVGLAGLVANLVMLTERLMMPLFEWHQLFGASAFATRAISYAFFGLAAGLVGAGLAAAVKWWRRSA